jgi:hypothetical protein
MSKSEEFSVDEALIKLEEKLNLSAKDAIRNARSVGYGFIMIKRNNRGYSDFTVKNILWHEMDEILTEMGARGGFYHGRD